MHTVRRIARDISACTLYCRIECQVSLSNAGSYFGRNFHDTIGTDLVGFIALFLYR
jgi:hypothetical protein